MNLYTIELNINGLDERLISAMKKIGTDNCFDVFNHGSDRLVFASKTGVRFTNCINFLDQVCKNYGVDYVSLLV